MLGRKEGPLLLTLQKEGNTMNNCMPQIYRVNEHIPGKPKATETDSRINGKSK